MTTITINRATVEQALEILEKLVVGSDYEEAVEAEQAMESFRAALAQQAEPVEPVAWAFRHSDGTYHDPSVTEHSAGMVPLYPPPPQRKPLTIERLRDALVASRIIPPAAVEDPDEYDDGVTLHRIEALHRRIT